MGRHINRDGSQECPNCGVCKEPVEHVFFLRIRHMISEDKILQLFEVSAISSVYTAGDLIKKFSA